MNLTDTTLGLICEQGGGAISTGPFGSQLHASDYSLAGTPVVMPQDIGDNRISEDNIARVSEHHVERLRRHRLYAGDIVYSRRGDVERRALIREENHGWLCGTGCLRVSFGPNPVASAEFVSYQLGLQATRKWIVRHAVGATMLNLNTSILSNVPLRVPAIATQRAIAAVLGALDDKIAANGRLASTVENLADSVFARAVADIEMGPRTFEELASIQGGGTPSTKVEGYWNGEINWATPTDITNLNAPYLETTGRSITSDGLKACSSALHPVGSILMTSRATIGAFAIAQAPTAVNQGFIVVNAHEPDHQWWMFHEMRSRVPEFLSHANGATFLELSRGKFKKFLVRLPDEAAVKEFSSAVAPLHERARAASIESTQLAKARDVLLPLLMSGKLRVDYAERILAGATVGVV